MVYTRKQRAVVSAGQTMWRMDDPVMEGESVVEGGMWQHQRDWWTLPHFVKLLIGGYGSGKTISAGKRAIWLSILNAPVPIACVSPTFTMARKTVIETIDGLLDAKIRYQKATGGAPLSYSYHKTEHVFRISWMGLVGRIEIYSGEDPKRLKGPNLGAALIDEPFIQEEAVFQEIAARVRHPGAKFQEIGLLGTPEKLAYGLDLVERTGKWSKIDCAHVVASTRANLALPAHYVQNLEGAFDEKAQRAYIEGEFINLMDGAIFYGFDPERHRVSGHTAPEGAIWMAGMDFNVNPMAFVVGWRVGGGRIHFVKDFELPNADTQLACDTIRKEFPQVTEIYPDPTGNQRATQASAGETDHAIIRKNGFRVVAPTSPWGLRDSLNSSNGAFAHDRISVDRDGCERLSKYLRLADWETANKEAGKKMGHLLDAMRYAITYHHRILRHEMSISGYS